MMVDSIIFVLRHESKTAFVASDIPRSLPSTSQFTVAQAATSFNMAA
jgi:hypothetical protein